MKERGAGSLFRGCSGLVLHIISERVEPGEHACVPLPRRWLAASCWCACSACRRPNRAHVHISTTAPDADETTMARDVNHRQIIRKRQPVECDLAGMAAIKALAIDHDRLDAVAAIMADRRKRAGTPISECQSRARIGPWSRFRKRTFEPSCITRRFCRSAGLGSQLPSPR